MLDKDDTKKTTKLQLRHGHHGTSDALVVPQAACHESSRFGVQSAVPFMYQSSKVDCPSPTFNGRIDHVIRRLESLPFYWWSWHRTHKIDIERHYWMLKDEYK